ncbi:hypothetical protein YYC_05321 [Plasmodium yoelii 17X]|uniref:Uncharacterized protein n=1 Tax=Plasmodium yoelii 17X TaxID=1323249 RepID=V7PBM9_PLAYE|nr:hypothetical protein YYC_05321 [Plasmodium yoelii 17X]
MSTNANFFFKCIKINKKYQRKHIYLYIFIFNIIYKGNITSYPPHKYNIYNTIYIYDARIYLITEYYVYLRYIPKESQLTALKAKIFFFFFFFFFLNMIHIFLFN